MQKQYQNVNFDENMLSCPGPCGHFACSGLSSYRNKQIASSKTIFSQKKEPVFHKNRPERARRKRIRAETLGIRNWTIQDAFKHLPQTTETMFQFRTLTKRKQNRQITKTCLI